jgi:hypothetical protein
MVELPPSPQFLTHVLRVLRPGGVYAIIHPKTTNICTSLLLGGLTDISTGVAYKDDFVETVCKRPPWEATASAPLSFLKKKKTAPAPAVIELPKTTGNVWTLGGDDLNDDDLDLEDEDDLLAHEDEKVTVAVPSK